MAVEEGGYPREVVEDIEVSIVLVRAVADDVGLVLLRLLWAKGNLMERNRDGLGWQEKREQQRKVKHDGRLPRSYCLCLSV